MVKMKSKSLDKAIKNCDSKDKPLIGQIDIFGNTVEEKKKKQPDKWLVEAVLVYRDDNTSHIREVYNVYSREQARAFLFKRHKTKNAVLRDIHITKL